MHQLLRQFIPETPGDVFEEWREVLLLAGDDAHPRQPQKRLSGLLGTILQHITAEGVVLTLDVHVAPAVFGPPDGGLLFRCAVSLSEKVHHHRTHPIHLETLLSECPQEVAEHQRPGALALGLDQVLHRVDDLVHRVVLKPNPGTRVAQHNHRLQVAVQPRQLSEVVADGLLHTRAAVYVGPHEEPVVSWQVREASDDAQEVLGVA
mmetsp:Transcript_39051/g.111599  ORF Transcript_39051/g.111599 Transcript_39051/m.111599 type:complete len:206 (-) Transcript_39051:1029-1646(-)